MTEIGLLKPRMAYILLLLKKKLKPGKKAPLAPDAALVQRLIADLICIATRISVSHIAEIPIVVEKVDSIKDPELVGAILGTIEWFELETKIPIETMADYIYIPRPAFKKILQQEAVEFVRNVSKSLCEQAGLPLPPKK